MQQLRRGAGDRHARVLILTCRRCQGREKFVVHSPKNFRRISLTKQTTEQVINKKHGSMRVLCSRVPCGELPPPPPPLARVLHPRAPMLFYNKSAPKVTGEAVTFGAMLYKSLGSRGIMPLAGSRGRAPWASLPGCRGSAHAGVKGRLAAHARGRRRRRRRRRTSRSSPRGRR